ncbi:MAG: agmatine deiminase family protein [Planctomycetaceae bacterium]|nr:agmatine deiminase family protein [Planctomycetaceae bacterium]
MTIGDSNPEIDLHRYRWPAEWEEHSATWLAWPVNPNTWPGIFDRIPPAFARFVAAVARFEPVGLLVGDTDQESVRRLVESECEAAGAVYPVRFVDIPVNDSWCRDHGPIFLTGRPGSSSEGQTIALDWDYNAWGGKYEPYDRDQMVGRRIAAELGLPVVRPGFVLEGGAIDGNGAGTVLTTTACLLNETRNGAVTPDAVERYLSKYLQTSQTVWLPGHGIVGDDTDGHVDQVARFVSATAVAVAVSYDDDSAEAADLRCNADAVSRAVNAQGEGLQVIPIRIPPPRFQQEQRLPASYCNFCMVNGAVIVPTFQDSADDVAMQQLQTCFPDRLMVGVDSLDLVWGLGSFHCLSQQQPKASIRAAH